MVCAPTMRPPPPMPWMARKMISSVMVWDSPAVAELAPQRRGHRRSQQVGGDHPGQPGQAVQITGDGRQRRRDDGLVEGSEEHPEEQPGHDDENLAPAQLWRSCRFGKVCGLAHDCQFPLGTDSTDSTDSTGGQSLATWSSQSRSASVACVSFLL